MKKLLLLFSLLLSAGIAGAQCIASLSATQAPSGNNLLRFTFTNSSYYGLPFSGQLKSYDVYYGDGAVSYGVPGTTVPAHIYAAPGTYTVGFRMRSYDSASGLTVCTDSVGILVTASYPACGSTISVTSSGATRTFTATNPAGTTGITYSWNYGDGFTGTGSPASHTYAASGTYTVTLTATAGSGPSACTYTNTISVVVYIPPPALNCGTLSANFVFSVSGAIASFTNSSSIATPTSSYQSTATWNYGDGTVGAGFNTPPHTYAAPGVYSVKLVMIWRDSLFTTSCRDSITKVVTITSVPSPANIISGNIFYDSTGGMKYFKVYLIKYDSATTTLSAVDSLITGNTSSPYYSFGSKPAGSYRTKAAEWTGTTFGTGFIPTYHDSSLYWNLASVINHTGGSTLNRRIWMKKGTPTTGVGFIGGNVSLGANKGAAGGVYNLLVYLRDANMRVIQAAFTDASGNYSFSNLPMAPYSVWPELMNYATIPVTPIVLNATNPSKTAIDFNLDDAKRNIAPRGMLAVCNCIADRSITVSPIPANGKITISWSSLTSASEAQFSIVSLTGNVVGKSPVVHGANGSVDMALGNLSSGVYFVHGSGSFAGNVTKLVVQ